ncbi:MAG: hypothetical protein Ct9H300mP11_02870 [Chloroflexota bacterium]|nr:MAG: hypothetical protein Ct9H300mP11_02870 [Chloroflexota bacterium]
MMTDSAASRPSSEELKDAFQAGFNSIDDGDGFYQGSTSTCNSWAS